MSMMSSFKGMLGETVINIATWLKLDKESYHRLNNITLPLADGGSTQIDHVIVSKYGIFVIETKNYKGWIYGNEKQRQWTQAFANGSKYKFQNPLRQNYLHIKTLAELLDLELSHFHSMIAFIGECELKTRDELPAHVLKGGIVTYIKSKQNEMLTEAEVLAIVAQIESKRFTKSWRTNREHKAYLKDKYSTDKPSDHNSKTFKSSTSTPTADKSDNQKSLDIIVGNGVSTTPKSQPITQERMKSKDVQQWSGQAERDDLLSMPFTSKNAVFLTPFEVTAYELNEVKAGNVAVKIETIDSKQSDSIINNTAVPNCPKCESTMIERVAKKGARQGQTFYGCSQFPKCREIVNVSA